MNVNPLPMRDRIINSDLPFNAKALAHALLKDHIVGTEFVMTTGALRKMVKGQVNTDFVKPLRELKIEGLLEYSINNPPTIVTIKFLD